MSDLSFVEKRKLEILFGMSDGYVLNFSNRTFHDFCIDSVAMNIYDDKYSKGRGSKASRLRAFWSVEPNHIVVKLLTDLFEHSSSVPSASENQVRDDCARIIERLKQACSVADLEAITPNSPGREFEVLANSIREAIHRNEPEMGMDRLHTFLMKYLRTLSIKHAIPMDRDKPLHSLFGEYLKWLKKQGMIQSDMTNRILKSSISVMEAFNWVRNEQSLAHDNPVLNYNEALLIFNNVASAIRFIAALEDQGTFAMPAQEGIGTESTDTPF